MSLQMMASTSSRRVRPTAVRSRSLVSTVRTHWMSAVAVRVQPGYRHVCRGAGSRFPLLDLDRDGQVVSGVVIDDQDGGDERAAILFNHRKPQKRAGAIGEIHPVRDAVQRLLTTINLRIWKGRAPLGGR